MKIVFIAFIVLLAVIWGGNAAQAVGGVVSMWSVSAQTEGTQSTASTLQLASNKLRKYLRVKNRDSSIVLYVKVGSAHSANEGVSLAAGAVWEPIVVPAGAIYLKSASGNPSWEIVEGH